MSTEPDNIIDLFNEYSITFDKLCQQRYEIGAQEYGPFTFLENDVIRMMAEELVDIANYARMQFVKLMIMQGALVGEVRKTDSQAVVESFGMNSFKGAKDGWQN